MLHSLVPGNGNSVKVLGSGRYDIEYALKLWKRNLKESDIVNELKSRMEYEKPTTKRRKAKNDAIRNRKRNERL
jgi:ribosomal protein S21